MDPFLSSRRVPVPIRFYSLFIACLLLNLPLKGQFDGVVRIWEDTLTLPTYLVHPPDVNPMFFRNQSYQGASRVIYPYPLQDNLSNDKKDVIYKAVYLENKYIKLCILPEIGGKLFYATDKTNGYEIFYRHRVIKPAIIGMLGAWISGGIEFCVFHHHRASTFLPVDYTLVQNKNGSSTIWIGETEPRHRMKWSIGITLYPDKSYIEVSGTLMNLTENTHSMLYWANVATHANDDYQIIFPPSTQIATYHAKNSFCHWPITQEPYVNRDYYSNGIDASWWKNHPEPVSFFAHNLKEGFLAGYDHGKNAGTMHVGNPYIVTGAKLWEWGPGPSGAMWDNQVLTDNGTPYAELMTGAYSDNQPDYSWIKPYEIKQFKQYWYPIRETNGIKTANLKGLLNLEVRSGDTLFIAANTTEKHKNARIRVMHKSNLLFEEDITIDPSEPYSHEIHLDDPVDEEDLCLILLDNQDNELIRYQPVHLEEVSELPEAVKPPLQPEEIKTIEELYLTGLRIKQFHNARMDPNDYFREALSRDPGDIRCNIQMGLSYKEQGYYEVAAGYFRKAIHRLTKEYTRPRDCEPLYHLGVILQKQGKYENAIDTLYRAVWDYSYRSASYYHLAQISTVKNDYHQALEHLDNCLINNSQNLSALNLKCAILRKTGKKEKAEEIANSVLDIDPLNFRALNEKYLLQNNLTAKDPEIYYPELLIRMIGENPESYLELVVEYLNSGLYDESIALLILAGRSGPERVKNYPTIYYYLGYLYHLKGKQSLAGENFRKARSLPTDYCFPYRLETMQVYQTALEYAPDDSRAHYYLGNLHFDKQPEKAMKEWEEAVSIEKDLSIAYRNLGWGYSNYLDDPEKAIEAYESAIQYNREQPRYYYELDLLYEKQGVRIEKRLKLLTENHQYLMKREDALIREIKVLVDAKEYDRAIQYLTDNFFHSQEGSRNLHEIHINAHLLRGLKRIRMDKYGEALDDFHRANEYPDNHQLGRAQNYTRNPQIEYYTGLAYELTNQPEKAKIHYEKATSDQRMNNQYIYYVGCACEKLNNPERADRIYEQLIMLGMESLSQANEVDFFAKFSEGSEANRRLASAYFMQGLGYLGKGTGAKAREMFEKTLELDPNHLWAKEMMVNHGYETPKQALETYSAAELRGTEFTSSAKPIKPSAFGGIVRLTNFNALRF